MPIFPEHLIREAEVILQNCKKKHLRVATAESCTGGLIASLLTDVPGSSHVFERGFVTYANEAKIDLLGVTADTILEYGAVSEPVACAMARGAVKGSPADIAVSVTGIAGPDGGTETKPVGLVHLACYHKDGALLHERCIFSGNRDEIRLAAVEEALNMMNKMIHQVLAASS